MDCFIAATALALVIYTICFLGATGRIKKGPEDLPYVFIIPMLKIIVLVLLVAGAVQLYN